MQRLKREDAIREKARFKAELKWDLQEVRDVDAGKGRFLTMDEFYQELEQADGNRNCNYLPIFAEVLMKKGTAI